MNNRAKHALKLRQQGLSFSQIGKDLGIGSERARQIVRKYQRHLKLLEDPFIRKIKELSRLGEATRILNALKGNEFYDGDLEKLTNYKSSGFNENPGIGHKKSLCHCQGAGKHGGYWECGGMVGKIGPQTLV